MRLIIKLAIMLAFVIGISLPAIAENASTDSTTSKDAQKTAPSSEPVRLYTDITARKYVLGPNDIINVSVLGIPEFSQDAVKVQPDGKINISGMESIYVNGMTFEDLRNRLNEKYSYYVKNPNVLVQLKRCRPFIIQVSGAVSIPGSYEINTDTETSSSIYDSSSTYVERRTPILSNVLTAAGGINYDADIEHIQISNRFENTEYEINLLDLVEKGKSPQDIYLMAGDSVHVPSLPSPLAINSEKYRKFASSTFANRVVPVRVLGYVNTPGLIKLDASLSPNLNTAIAEAGGYRNDSSYPPKLVYISRTGSNGKLVTTTVNPMKNDIALLPNDIVYVPDKPRSTLGRAFDYVLRIAEPASSIAGSYNNWSLMFNPTRYNSK